ncbi:MAG TPA: LamG-like jellyroll fold domain-containing protein [Planctomycetota bacterium]
MIAFSAGILSLVAAQGPVGWWRGDDGAAPTTAADSSGFNRPGTYTSGATTSTATFPPGLFNNDSVFEMDGADDQVTVAHNAAFNITGNLTVAFWMRKVVAEQGDWVRLVGKGSSTNRTIGVWEEAGAGRHILFQQYNAGAAVVSFFSAGEVALDTWTHVACTVDTSVVAAGSCQIYLNGAASGAAVNRTGTPSTDTQPVRFGYGEIHTYHRGQLDEVRLFNRVLTLTEIQTLAGQVASAIPQNLNFTNTTPGGTTLNWDAAAGATSYVVQRSIGGGAFVTVASGIAGLSYTDSGLTPGTTYTYVVYAVGLVNSADSTPSAVMIPFPPPRTNDHSEGLFDENCSCGSTASGAPAAWALFAALALLAFRRR